MLPQRYLCLYIFIYLYYTEPPARSFTLTVCARVYTVLLILLPCVTIVTIENRDHHRDLFLY